MLFPVGQCSGTVSWSVVSAQLNRMNALGAWCHLLPMRIVHGSGSSCSLHGNIPVPVCTRIAGYKQGGRSLKIYAAS